jgi:hypothetical protein
MDHDRKDVMPAFFQLMLDSSEEDKKQATHLVAGLMQELETQHYPAFFSVLIKTLAEFVWHDPTVDHKSDHIGAAVVPLEENGDMYCAVSFQFIDRDTLFATNNDTVH